MNASAEREKAATRPIDGRYPALAKEVRNLLGWDEAADFPYLTLRMASRKTGVNYTTLSALARGDKSKADTLTRVASGLGGDPQRLLMLAGYLPDIYRPFEVQFTESIARPERPAVSNDVYRQKALSRKIVGPYPRLAVLVRKMMGWEGDRTYLTTRMAARKTNCNNVTISSMLRGERASYETICKFAAGFHVDPRELLYAGGYVPVSEIPEPEGYVAEAGMTDSSIQILAAISDKEFAERELIEQKSRADGLAVELKETKKELAAVRLKLKKIASLVKEIA